ncbi:MAG: hypothetical protein J6S71_01325 [Clostridia bacterium]|nr:hypothetical protein [Clostridia bacterium]
MSDNLRKPTEGYSHLYAYASSPPAPYADFDQAAQTGLNLFALREDLDLVALSEILDRIIAVLPALKRIFSAPIIRLRDSGEILPVEAVRVVNSKTLSHISVHSELWSNIKDDKLIPRKLMSIRQEDDYAIYENIVFARTVDVILRFTSRNLAVLRDMLYANREMHFNLLERENHPLYFLALGKLHTGYLRDYDKYLFPIEKCYEKLSLIEHALIPRLSMPVYKKCRKKGAKLGLKKTNIFRSHKDYRKLYSLAKYFSEIGLDSLSSEDGEVGVEEYSAFCAMLCVFAAGHFNFKFDKNRNIDFKNINIDASFGEWKLNVRAEKGGTLLTVTKDRDYRILLCPPNTEPCEADEVVPVSADGEEAVRLSIYDIDSFRRIQQMLLRAMIYADAAHKICPFCGKELADAEDACECGACRTVITKKTCTETGKEYYSTDIKHFSKAKTKKFVASDAAYHFRNITPVSESGALLCPECGKEH